MEWFDEIQQRCIKYADSSKAIGMKAYMKNQFEFFGIQSPGRKVLVQSFKVGKKISADQTLWSLVDLLWLSPYREMQYIAIDLLIPISKTLKCDDLVRLEQMIVSKSWWDTVDAITSDIVGAVFRNDKTCREKFVYSWMNSQNIWLQRSAIIFQLKYKKDTDWNLLCESILKNDTSKAFFVRKAQGWALRTYSSIDPNAVIDFVTANPQLSGLTKREAMRKIKI